MRFLKISLVSVAALMGMLPVSTSAEERSPFFIPVQAVPDKPLPEGSGTQAPASETDLDSLFASLKRERNEGKAKLIADRIWLKWAHSDSATVDLLMVWASDAVEKNNYPLALDLYDQAITLAPDFAEAWNRRATLHFTMASYAKSMVDIERTLAIEPRHFGALSGMGMILRNTGRPELALEAYSRALDIYPAMRSAQDQLMELADELAGRGI